MKHVCENFGRVLICIQKGKLKKKGYGHNGKDDKEGKKTWSRLGSYIRKS